MATVSEGNANFIQGLSDLWIRFFKDKPTLEALYSGMEIPVGQAYLELLSNVLNISVREAPVFRKEFFKLLTVREDLVVFDTSTATYRFELTNLNIRDFKFLYNKIFAPTVILEKMVDFTIETEELTGEETHEFEGDIDYLTFSRDPFDWAGDGLPIPGVAYRTVDVAQDDGTVERERELALWVPDAQVDTYDMYLNYGYLLNYFSPSSESYRALLQGIIQYFVLGPTTQHLTSALNVMLGLPVIRDDGEILQGVDTSDPLYQVVQTSRANYQFDATIPLRPDVLDSDNWGTLTFQAFEHLSDLFHVHDSVAEPTWFFDSLIPAKLLPDESRARRGITPQLWENKIDNPSGLVKIGDPGFIVGRDDDGGEPTGGRPTYRHLFSYVVFERFLKHHVFTLEFDPAAVLSGAIPFPRFNQDLMNIVQPGKSAYTFLIVEPSLVVSDTLRLYSEQVSLLIGSTGDVAKVNGVPNQLRVGDDRHPWKIGDYYTYSAGSIVVGHWPIGNRFENGKTPLIVGGANPTNRGGLVTWKSPGGFFNVSAGEGYLQHTNNVIPSGRALVEADVGRYIYRPLNKTWFRITRLTTYYIIGFPMKVRVTAYLDSVPSPTTPSGIGESWQLYDTPTTDQLTDWAPQIKQVGGFPSKDFWGVGEGSGLAQHYDGIHWKDYYLSWSRQEFFRRVWGSATDDFWAVGTRWADDVDMPNSEGIVYRWDGENWASVFTFREDGLDVEGLSIWGAASDDVWVGAVGIGGLYHWDGSSWTKFPIGDMDGPFQANSIWGSASNDVYAAGQGIMTFTGKVWHWDGALWSVVATGAVGESFFSHVWGLGANEVWALGYDTGVYHWNGAVWVNTLPPPPTGFYPYALQGQTLNDIWLTGWDDTAIGGVVYHWNGAAWIQDLTIGYIDDPIGIWAKSVNEVYLLTQYWDDNTGGWITPIYLWDGATWSLFRWLTYPNKSIFGIWGI